MNNENELHIGTPKLSELIEHLQDQLIQHGDFPIVSLDPDDSGFSEVLKLNKLDIVKLIHHPHCNSFIKTKRFNKFSQPFKTELQNIACGGGTFEALEIDLT